MFFYVIILQFPLTWIKRLRPVPALQFPCVQSKIHEDSMGGVEDHECSTQSPQNTSGMNCNDSCTPCSCPTSVILMKLNGQESTQKTFQMSGHCDNSHIVANFCPYDIYGHPVYW